MCCSNVIGWRSKRKGAAREGGREKSLLGMMQNGKIRVIRCKKVTNADRVKWETKVKEAVWVEGEGSLLERSTLHLAVCQDALRCASHVYATARATAAAPRTTGAHWISDFTVDDNICNHPFCTILYDPPHYRSPLAVASPGTYDALHSRNGSSSRRNPAIECCCAICQQHRIRRSTCLCNHFLTSKGCRR